jgi:hypothetical protein
LEEICPTLPTLRTPNYEISPKPVSGPRGSAEGLKDYFRIVASLDRKRLGTKISSQTSWARGVFDEEASRKPLAFAADAVSYGI